MNDTNDLHLFDRIPEYNQIILDLSINKYIKLN